MSVRSIGETTFWLLRVLRHVGVTTSTELHEFTRNSGGFGPGCPPGGVTQDHVYRMLQTLVKYGFVEREDWEGPGHLYYATEKWAPHDRLVVPTGWDGFVWGDQYGQCSIGECMRILEKGERYVRVKHSAVPTYELKIAKRGVGGDHRLPFLVTEGIRILGGFPVPRSAMLYAQEVIRPPSTI